ncbi:MAG: helix-turn-helix domain-containing protein [Croceibacterium sp.]
MGSGTPVKGARAFDAEVARLHAAGLFGETGRLRELFDFLAGRGVGAHSASQSEIAETVFGQADGGSDDATVRVYIHRLRKRLDEFYVAHEAAEGRLTVPAGAYALRLAGGEGGDERQIPERPDRRPLMWLALAALLALAAFFIGRDLVPAEPVANALWQPFLRSGRPLTIVVGDYYMFGEIDELRPERGRLIRDFRVNSPTDLVRLEETEPDRYGAAEDVGLYYLPMSTAYALRELMPVLAHAHRPIEVVPASQLHADTLRTSDIVYVGLISGMGMLEDLAFSGSQFQVGESYDEVVDTGAGKSYVSEEARSLASPVSYRDYGLVARFKAPGGALVAIVAGARDTGLRGLAPLLADKLGTKVGNLAGGGNFEALYQITGQQGADLSERLVQARTRR